MLQLLASPLSLVFPHVHLTKRSDPLGFLPQLQEVTFYFLIVSWLVLGLVLILVRVTVKMLYQKGPQETRKRVCFLLRGAVVRKVVGGRSAPHGYLMDTSVFCILLLHSSRLMVKAKSSARLASEFELMERKGRKNIFSCVAIN